MSKVMSRRLRLGKGTWNLRKAQLHSLQWAKQLVEMGCIK